MIKISYPWFRSPSNICIFLFVTTQLYFYLILYSQSESQTEWTKSKSDDEADSDYRQGRQFYQRGSYTILSNFIEGIGEIGYMDTITLVTHATVAFLDNVEPLVSFWSGPISVAVYAPGLDFSTVLDQITFLRECIEDGPKVKDRVTFHILFDTQRKHLPEATNLYEMELPTDPNCTAGFPNRPSYRTQQKLLFPINVCRNVAREGAQTHYVLVSDIELYPNPPDLIPKFLRLVKGRPELQEPGQVFVLPPFEVKFKVGLGNVPRNKTALLRLLKSGKAVKFHKYTCDICHRLPSRKYWASFDSVEANDELTIYVTSGYISRFAWEPFYIGTQSDPPFDERIYREYALNKVIQANALCNLGYRFHVLGNAFLVHKPGVRVGNSKSQSKKSVGKSIVKSSAKPLQRVLYGTVKKCA